MERREGREEKEESTVKLNFKFNYIVGYTSKPFLGSNKVHVSVVYIAQFHRTFFAASYAIVGPTLAIA